MMHDGGLRMKGCIDKKYTLGTSWLLILKYLLISKKGVVEDALVCGKYFVEIKECQLNVVCIIFRNNYQFRLTKLYLKLD